MCLLATAGVFYYNDFNGRGDASPGGYDGQDVLTALYIALIALACVVLLSVLFDGDIKVD
jgi:hypothetical protein